MPTKPCQRHTPPHPAASSPSPQPPQPLPFDVATPALSLLQAHRPRRRRSHLDIATPALTPPTLQLPPLDTGATSTLPQPLPPSCKPPTSLPPRHHRTKRTTLLPPCPGLHLLFYSSCMYFDYLYYFV